MYDDAQKLLDILALFRRVERQVSVRGSDRLENDAEHSYSLALMAWMLSAKFPELDRDKVVRYALVHDLVEAYAGDTYIWDEASVATKHEREKAAERRIHDELCEAFPELCEAIESYEKREDQEAKFVWVLDKLIAPLVIGHSERAFWKEQGITFDAMRAHKEGKVEAFPGLRSLYDAMVAALAAVKDERFSP